jgi:hypothetical protein
LVHDPDSPKKCTTAMSLETLGACCIKDGWGGRNHVLDVVKEENLRQGSAKFSVRILVNRRARHCERLSEFGKAIEFLSPP